MIIAEKEGKRFLLNFAFVHSKGTFGGKNRSIQLLEMFKRNGFIFKQVNGDKSSSKIQTLILGVKFWLRFGFYKPICIDSLRSAAHQMINYHYVLRQYNDLKAVLIEGTGFGVPIIVKYLKAQGIKVYFVPANVESLASYKYAWTHKIEITKRLQEDIICFRKSDGVFCISSEEQWLLEVMNIKAFYLPYYPPKDILRIIQKRNLNRQTSNKEDFYLYMADFSNEPSIKGFTDFINTQVDFLKQNSIKVKLIGKSSDKLKLLINDLPFIQYEGFVNDDKLEYLLSSCRGVIIYHYPSSGFLTRVIEMWMSGIPIYCNNAAMKSFIHMPNVHSFDQLLFKHEENSEAAIIKYKEVVDYTEKYFLKNIQNNCL